MRKLLYSILLLGLLSCGNKDATTDTKTKSEVVDDEFNEILDLEDLVGSILIYDQQKDTYHSNDFSRADKGFIPASTFKIANSLIALETGIMKSDTSVIKWSGAEHNVEAWNQDLTFKEAFHLSCVPCYQEIARRVGVNRMKAHVEKFDFGTMDIKKSNIDQFWLVGDSKISQYDQIDFLQRFYHSQLPISKRTEKIAKRMMVREQTDAYALLGKTGRSTSNIGWFVGYVKNNSDVYFFATNVEPKGRHNPDSKVEATMMALEEMKIIQ